MSLLPDRRVRRLVSAAVLVSAALVAVLVGQASGRAATVPLSIAVQGNQFVNGAGQTVRLLGVDHASLEYACEEGYAYDDGLMDAPDAAAIASWHATAVRLPLNEDCWLGINGEPSNSQNPQPPLTMAGYRQAVEDYVTQLNNAGLYVILDLHWSAPGTVVADGQRPLPDGNSVAFWTSVATTFAANPGVVFDAFNEPFSPSLVNDPAHPVSWDCWKLGGCPLSVVKDSDTPNGSTYTAVGMQTMVDTIRATGARQPIMLGGLGYANDLSQWLAHEPSDPLGQLAASFHVYQGQTCDNQACWDAQVAPVAAQVPVVTGEFDQDVGAPSTFDVDYMNWADLHGVGYLAWGWWVLSPQEIADAGSSAYYLISDPTGTPAAPNGVNLHDHLLALANTPATTPTSTPTPSVPVAARPRLGSLTAMISRDGSAVRLTVRASLTSKALVSARTVAKFAVSGKHRQRVTLGSVRGILSAGKTRTLTLRFSPAARKLLKRQHTLKVQVTVTLTSSSNVRSVTGRTLTLKAPTAHRAG
ncbi:MAG: cellulase family glycosylhydrolase [Gaiellales bacterium]